MFPGFAKPHPIGIKLRKRGNRPSFPRSAWERTSGRSASRPRCADSAGSRAEIERDAERPDVRSHAERGNEGAFW